MDLDRLHDAVRRGTIATGEDYATACERIEYESAKLRHRGSTDEKHRDWPRDLDPTGRHFEGSAPRWGTFERYLGDQKSLGHWGRARDRFANLAERRAFLDEQARQIQQALATARADVAAMEQ
jgi:hypothetical protein